MEYGKQRLYKVDIIAMLLKNPLSHNHIEWKRILTAIYDVEIENSPSYDWENVRGQRRVGQGTWKMYNHFHFSVYAPTKLTANRGDCKLINGIKCLKQFSQQQQQKHRQVVRCNVKPKVVNVAASVAADLRLLMAPVVVIIIAVAAVVVPSPIWSNGNPFLCHIGIVQSSVDIELPELSQQNLWQFHNLAVN